MLVRGNLTVAQALAGKIQQPVMHTLVGEIHPTVTNALVGKLHLCYKCALVGELQIRGSHTPAVTRIHLPAREPMNGFHL